jgi:3D (Asp-Asp-Asp) domain-containing protein
MIVNILKTLLVTATVYNADPSQTDDTPFITASGAVIEQCCPGDHRWIAVSRDLEAEGFVFGARVRITGTDGFDGIWVVQDRMNRRYQNSIDLLVDYNITLGKWYNVELELLD